MSGFFLKCNVSCFQEDTAVRTLKSRFAQIGFRSGDSVCCDDYVLAAYRNFQEQGPHLVRYPNGDFVLVVGTCISERGIAPAREVYEADDPAPLLKQFFGHYAIVIRKNGKTELLCDGFGGFHLYYNQELGVVSTSLYAIASVLTRLTVSAQSIYEYVFNGVISGDETLFREINLVPLHGKLVVASGSLERARLPFMIPRLAGQGEWHSEVRNTVRLLDRSFAKIVHAFGDRIGTALSGGYDSRLILAFLRRHGVARPRLYVYGKKADRDVQFAARIAAGEGLPLAIIDKEADEHIGPDVFPQRVHANFLGLDGYGYGGVFNNGAELNESMRRVESNFIAFNGGGGEIFRNFFYLRDRAYTIRQLLWTFYSQFDPRCATELFQPEGYYRHLEGKVRALVGCDADWLPRPTVEWLYHAFRCRAWDGKVDSLANWYGYTAMPFLEQQVSEHASVLPISWKYHGAYEAALIEFVDPRLARYPSNYGHSFHQSPPFRRRLHDYATHFRPPWLRRYTHRIKSRFFGPLVDFAGYLAPEYVNAVLPGGPDAVCRLFRLDHVRDPTQYARILSLEYAFRQFGSSVKYDF